MDIDWLLKKGGVKYIDKSVLRRAVQHFAARIDIGLSLRNPQYIVDAYLQAAKLPSTAIRQILLERDDIMVSEKLLSAESAVLLCFRDESVPCALKYVTTTESSRLKALQGLLKHDHIVDFELVDDSYMVMPLYSTALVNLPYLKGHASWKLWQSMESALSYLHQHNLAHMDVKPSNIFIRHDGSFVLGDLGSLREVGGKTHSTRAYVPKDMQADDGGSLLTARIAIDWWMLALTFCEKTTTGVEREVGLIELTTHEVKDKLSSHEPMQGVWPHLQRKLDSD